MKKKRPPLSENQTEIMNVIWDEGEASVTQVLEVINKNRNVSRNTIQTMLTRLKKKGWLESRKVGNAYLYSAAEGQKQTLSDIAHKVVETAFSGSAENLIMALLEGKRITREEGERIQQMIDHANLEDSDAEQ